MFYSQTRYDDAAKQLSSNKVNPILSDHLLKIKQNQQQVPRTDNLRQLQIYAEAHALKGLCMEIKRHKNIANIPNYENNSEEQEIIDSFEISSTLAIQHSFQMHQLMNSGQTTPSLAQAASNSNQNTNSGANSTSPIIDTPNSTNFSNLNALNNSDDNLDLINPLYEIALQKAPLLYIKRG